MRKIAALLAVVAALVTASVAGATRPTVVDEGGGGSSTPQVYIIASITYNSNGFPIFLYCRYYDFGNGLVIQGDCWS